MERDQVQDFATLLQNGRRDDIKEICFLLRRDDALDDGWRERERERERGLNLNKSISRTSRREYLTYLCR